MRTTEIPFEPSRHPIIAARLAKHLVYDQAALVAEGIEKFGSYVPRAGVPGDYGYANAQALHLGRGRSVAGSGWAADPDPSGFPGASVLVQLDPATLERR